MESNLRALIVCLTAITVGCASTARETFRENRLRGSPPLPPATIDIAASELELTDFGYGPDGKSPEIADRLRSDIAVALDAALGGDGTTPTTPARFRVTGDVDTTMALAFVPCLLIGALVGCPSQYIGVDLRLDLQIGARTYSAEGKAWTLASMYYNVSNQRDWRGGLVAKAVLDAMRKIFGQPVGPAHPLMMLKTAK